MIMQQFTLYLENRPGRLAEVTAKLAKAKINIEGISVASASAQVGLVQIVVSNAAKARRVLTRARIPFTVQEVIVLPLSNEPGVLAAVTARLASAGINIDYIYATSCAGKEACRSYAIIGAPRLSKVANAFRHLTRE